jgi:hypothetical protein
MGESGAEIDGNGGLANAAFLITNSHDLRHRCSVY